LNILLATYSYFPYDFGGTEVYVSGLAAYLKRAGHHVQIVAATSLRAFEEHPVLFEDANLKMVSYIWEDVPVNAVMLKDNSADAIYQKHKTSWVNSWENALPNFGNIRWDLLHIHCNTAAVGLSLMEAVKAINPAVKIIGSYHLPLACSKSSLLFSKTTRPCTVKAEKKICTACIISTRTSISLASAKMLSGILPPLPYRSLPLILQLKSLVNRAVQNFHAFDNLVDLWISFSDQMKTHMILNAVSGSKIHMMRHGIDKVTFKEGVESERKEEAFLFVGRLARDKGFFTLLKAWLSLAPVPGRILQIIGREHMNDREVNQWKHTCAIRKDIQWLGEKNRAEVSGYMQKAACVIIPSECVETGPLVFHEAIACGADVIASDIGGCKELSGVYAGKSSTFEVGNSVSLANAINAFRYSGKKAEVASATTHYKLVSELYNK
jgi:glycosyltransferase involved in cell wall biosynthesis